MNFKIHKKLYFQVLFSIFIGILLGHFFPEMAIKMKPLGDGFIKLVRMMVPPIIFTTVVTGIAGMKNIREAGRIGIKALIYFEIITILAMLLGLLVANFYQPGSGLNISIQSFNPMAIQQYTHQESFDIPVFLLKIIPETMVSAFIHGDILSVLFVSLLFGFGLLHAGEKAKAVTTLIEQTSHVLFCIINFIMKAAPIGAFGAMAYAIGAHGINTLATLSQLLFTYYLTCLFFIFVILGMIARFHQFSLWKFLKYIREELLIVMSTSSSETVLPRMIKKLEKIGCGKSIVSLVLPAGYTFNLDGMCIYLTLATLFIAQCFNVHLSFYEQLSIIAVLLLTSKGAATITGGGFIVLASTLSSLQIVPVEGLALLLGIDRFMSEARALTNMIGNAVATIVIAKWEGEFDKNAASEILLTNENEKQSDPELIEAD